MIARSETSDATTGLTTVTVLDSTPTNAQVKAQADRNARAVRRLIKLVVAADIPTLLDDTTGV